MSDLAERLKSKGLSLNTAPPVASSARVPGALKAASSDIFAPSARPSVAARSKDGRAASGAPAAPAPLALSRADRHKLFTPLMEQGAKAVKEGQRMQAEAQDDLLDSVRTTLRKWVQDCLVKDEKRDRLLEKGLLKCRVQAKWSKGIDEKLKGFAAGIGARLAADGDKENAEKHPAWLPRNEKWLVGFDAAALEQFLSAHPSALEPPSGQVRALVEEAVSRGAAADDAVAEALLARFGPLRRATLDRARRIAAQLRRGTKRKGGPGAQASSEDQKARIETLEDVAWAAATLAPFGLKVDGGEPVVRAPSGVALSILLGLEAVAGMPDLVALLRDTSIGKVVAGYRRHPSADVAKAAKDLVSAWRASCRER